jgi:hypothetical protein
VVYEFVSTLIPLADINGTVKKHMRRLGRSECREIALAAHERSRCIQRIAIERAWMVEYSRAAKRTRR